MHVICWGVSGWWIKKRRRRKLETLATCDESKKTRRGAFILGTILLTLHCVWVFHLFALTDGRVDDRGGENKSTSSEREKRLKESKKIYLCKSAKEYSSGWERSIYNSNVFALLLHACVTCLSVLFKEPFIWCIWQVQCLYVLVYLPGKRERDEVEKKERERRVDKRRGRKLG